MIRAAIKPKTRNTYESGMRSVMTFLLSATTPMSPDIAFKDPIFWAMYIVYMADRGRTPETARHYISGCQTLFAEVGEQIRPLRWPLVRHLPLTYSIAFVSTSISPSMQIALRGQWLAWPLMD